MPNCTYCGKPAGLFRNSHSECRMQFERAIETIPAFFEKLLQSHLPAERFEHLLREVAATFHIGPVQLRALSIAGIQAMINVSMQEHVPTADDEDRILEVADALGLTTDDIPHFGDRLVKTAVLRDLEEGRIPDRVTVVGSMPFELRPDESIVWIFNNVKSYRPPKPKEVAANVGATMRGDMPVYFSPASFAERCPQVKESTMSGISDLMITNLHIFVVSDDRHKQIPLMRVAGCHTYSDGFQVVRGPADDRPLTFIVDDPWFAANLTVRLLQLPANAASDRREASAVDAS